MKLHQMEDNQLNFNQPFLSVRRYSEKEDRLHHPNIATRLPTYKLDVKSGSVRDPGAVPFVWEQIPGKRKDEKTPQIGYYSERFSTAPKLPPGRQESDNSLGFQAAEKIQVVNSHFSQDNAHDPIREDDSSDSSNDEVYLDALDTLSRTESFFFNCSVSGVSGFEDIQPPAGAFSTDPQAKHFMIDRFLPAAKAMASESPQITQPKKQPIVPDHQPRHPMKVVNDNKGPQLRYGPSFAKQHAEYYVTGEDESDDEFDESEISQAKVCGLVPRFFLRGSHGLLNHIPAKSVGTKRPPLSPASREEGTVSSASSWSKPDHEHSSFDTSERKSIDVHEETKTEHISSHTSESKNTSNADLSSLGIGYKSFKDMLSEKNIFNEVDSGCLEVEKKKTIYIDSIRKFNDSPQMELCPLRNDQEHDSSRKGMWSDFYKESTLRNESGNAHKEDKLDTNLINLHDFKAMAFGQYQKSKKRILEAEKNDGGIFLDFSIPPPLPKSPSDSWLCRTLPSIYSKNTFKTSKTQELLASIPENQRNLCAQI